VATLRVVPDTNVLLSGIAYPASLPGKILAAWCHGSVDVLLPVCILEELRHVLPRLEHRHGLTAAEIDDLDDVLSIQAEVIEPLPRLEPDLRDANDQPVLATLLAALNSSGAHHLVTGEKDLRALADRHAMVTPAAFRAAHGRLRADRRTIVCPLQPRASP
jgi:putative PIN family toxin of toxin-antitoxin system